MACWECLLSPQCVFTEPNSFLGRNGASLRNMCTTHLLLLLPHSHTHIHTLRHTSPPPNNKSNLWHLGFGSSVSSGAARWREEAATSECDITSHVSGVNGSGGAKNKGPRREHVCYWRLNEWMHEGLAVNGHTMSWLVWHVATEEICGYMQTVCDHEREMECRR